jgi:site-specific recombinase XerD
LPLQTFLEKTLNDMKTVDKSLYYKEDLVQHRYLTANINVLYCSDITQLGDECFLTCLLDAGSRLVLAHALTSQEPTTTHVIQMIKLGLANRTIRENLTIFHSDRGNQYTSLEFEHFLQEKGLRRSLAPPQSHGNQLSENLNKTLKTLTRRLLVTKLGPEKHHKTNLKVLTSKFQFQELSNFVKEAIEIYCNRPHQGAASYKAAPFSQDEALALNACETNSLTRNNNGPAALEVRAHKAYKLGLYVQNVSVSREEPFNSDTQLILDHTRSLALGLATQTEQVGNVLALQNKLLFQQNQELENKVDYLVKQAEIAEETRLKKEALKQKRLSAKKQKIREAVTPSEFASILDAIEGTSYKASRIRVGLVLIYLTGLRVSNLLKFKVYHIDNLLESGSIIISLIKKGSPRHQLHIGAEGRKLLNKANINRDIEVLKGVKGLQEDLFTSQIIGKHGGSLISRELLDRELNFVLKEASLRLGKHIRTHSFRATFITDLLESGVSIEKVKDIIGHTSIRSTSHYRRSFLSKKELANIMNNLAKANRASFFDKKIARKRLNRDPVNK